MMYYFAFTSSICLMMSGQPNPQLKYVRSFVGQKRQVFTVTISPNGKWVATGGTEKIVRVFDAKTGDLMEKIESHDSAIASILYSPDGKYLVTSESNEGEIEFQDVNSFRVKKLVVAKEGPHCMVFSPDGKTLAAGLHNNTIAIWNLKSGRQIGLMKGHQQLRASYVTSLAFSPDSKYLATAGRDGFVIVWDLASFRVKHRLKSAPKRYRHAVAWSKNGLLTSGGAGADLIFWNAATGKLQKQLNLLQKRALGRIYDMAFSPDGNYLAVVGFGPNITMIDAKTGKVFITPEAHNGSINCLQFSADGRFLVTGSDDRTAKLWQVIVPKEKPKN